MTVDEVYQLIRKAHHEDHLPELIGKALGKTGVLIALIDIRGGVTVCGNNNTGLPTRTRDGSMIRQMAELLDKNMDGMMKIAGKV